MYVSFAPVGTKGIRFGNEIIVGVVVLRSSAQFSVDIRPWRNSEHGDTLSYFGWKGSEGVAHVDTSLACTDLYVSIMAL